MLNENDTQFQIDRALEITKDIVEHWSPDTTRLKRVLAHLELAKRSLKKPEGSGNPYANVPEDDVITSLSWRISRLEDLAKAAAQVLPAEIAILIDP